MSVLNKARARITELVAIEKALVAVAAREQDLKRLDHDAVVGHAMDSVLADGAVPEDLGRRLEEVRLHNEVIDAEGLVLRTMTEELRHRRRDAHINGADSALTYLAVEMGSLLDEVRPALAEIGGCATADEAITAGGEVIDAWALATRLAARHAELRSAQAIIVDSSLNPPEGTRIVRSTASPQTVRLVATFGTARNFAALFPELEGFEMADPVTPGRGWIDGRAPSPDPEWMTADDPLRALRALVGAGAELWVPSVQQLTSARDEGLAARAERRAAPEEPLSPGVHGLAGRRDDRQMDRDVADHLLRKNIDEDNEARRQDRTVA